MTLPELTDHINEAVNPNGDEPLITGPALNGVLHTLASELYPAPAPVPEADLSSNSPTAAPSVRAVATALAASGQHLAEARTSDRVRTGYPSAQAALDGAGDQGTAHVYGLTYGAIDPNDRTTTVPGLLFPATALTTNLDGLTLRTPDANTDLFAFTGGTQVLNGHHSTVFTHPVLHNTGLGLTVTAHSGAVQDVTIHNLHLVVQGRRTHALYFSDPGRYQYSGNITALRVPTLAAESGNFRWLVHNTRGTLLGKGTIVAYGNDAATLTPDLPGVNTGIFLVNTNGTTTWEGSIKAYDDVAIYLGYSATLVLREGVLDARERFVGTGPLFRNVAGTVILENYTVLARPEDEAIRADTLILRGNSVVVGTLNATHVIDERPAGAGASGTPAADVVHLAGTETITGAKTFTGDVFIGNGQDGSGLKIRKPSGEGYQRLLDVTNVDRPNSINFGAVGEGGDLRYHGTTHRWLANGGGAARMLLDEQSALTVAGPVRAAAFVGDGAQLTGLPAAERPANKGVANGYAPLDAAALVPAANLPPYPVGVTQDQVNILAGRFVVSKAGVVRTYTNLLTTTLAAGDTVYLPYNGTYVSRNQAYTFKDVTVVGNNCTLLIDNGIGWVFVNCQVRNLTLSSRYESANGDLNDAAVALIGCTLTECRLTKVAVFPVPGYVNGYYAPAVASTLVLHNVQASGNTFLKGLYTIKAYGSTTLFDNYSSYDGYANRPVLQDYRPTIATQGQLTLSTQLPAAAGSSVSIAHGLQPAAILGVSALAYAGQGLYVPPNYTAQAGLEYQYAVQENNVVLTTTANSASVLRQSVSLLLTYKLSTTV